MKNFLKLSLLFLPLILLTGCTINNQENENNSNNISERISYRVEENDKVQSNNHLTRYEPKVETKTIEEPIELKQNEVLSSFSTKIYDKNTNRMNNLKIGTQALNGKIVKAGETFSFNQMIGPYNKDNGYLKAKIFSASGGVYNEYGGGICQISTTLYNAVNKLNLEIIERHTHSRRVQYITNGKDATLSYGRLDFKFKNTLDHDILIESNVDKNNVYVTLKKN